MLKDFLAWLSSTTLPRLSTRSQLRWLLSLLCCVLFPGRLPLYTRAEDLSEGTRRTGVRRNNVI